MMTFLVLFRTPHPVALLGFLWVKKNIRCFGKSCYELKVNLYNGGIDDLIYLFYLNEKSKRHDYYNKGSAVRITHFILYTIQFYFYYIKYPSQKGGF